MECVVTRLKYGAAVMLGLMLGTATWAAGTDPYDGPQWPDVAFDGQPTPPSDGPRWPNLRLDDVDTNGVNPQPAFVNPQGSFLDPAEVQARIMGLKPRVPAPSHDSDATGSVTKPAAMDANANGNVSARWPSYPPYKTPSAFVYEAGARYWLSSGKMQFGFANQHPFFGAPTSTLDWLGLSANSGEAFGRVDHVPTGFFVKGLAGGGAMFGGKIDDRDFFVFQYKFSDTTSNVNEGWLGYAMIDIGWAYAPVPGMKFGVFAGYHYWAESVTAGGLLCNMASFLGCDFPGQLLIGYGTPVLKYQPTAHAARIGFTSQFPITDKLRMTADVAGIPFAWIRNKDSHLLRQSFDDLGTAPNVISATRYAYGVEAELLLNYALNPVIEVGGGLRYWGLTSRNKGDVTFGPFFNNADPLMRFDWQRYGLLLYVKGRF